MPIIEVSRLVKEFGAGRAPLRALDEVSFAVDQGRFVTLVGPNGCGKSTLLQILAGLTAATSGEARIEGERVCGPMPGKVGMVFQESHAAAVEDGVRQRRVPARSARRQAPGAAQALCGAARARGAC